MRISKTLWAIFTVILIAAPCFAHNEIDYISSYYWSGYKNIEFNGDTLYLGTLNGNGVERYLIDSAGVLYYLDRENICGYDLIDFDRYIMVKILTDSILLADFSDFADVQICSKITLERPLKPDGIRIVNNYLFLATNDDLLKVYNISDLHHPLLTNSIGFPNQVILGNTIALSVQNITNLANYRDVYDISTPESIRFIRTDTTERTGNTFIFNSYPAHGDTFAFIHIWGMLVDNMSIDMLQFYSDGNTINRYYNFYNCPGGYYTYIPSANSFLIGSDYNGPSEIHSFSDFSCKGKVQYPMGNLSNKYYLLNDSYLLYDDSVSLTTAQAPDSESYFQPIFTHSGDNYGVTSSYIYTDSATGIKYLLSGIAADYSLRAYRFDNQANLIEISRCDSIAPFKIYFKSHTAICAGANGMATIDLANIENNPVLPIVQTLRGFPKPLIDIANRDSFYYAISDSIYYLIKFIPQTGFTILATIDYPSRNLTSITQVGISSFVLKGSIGVMDNIITHPPNQPYIYRKYRLPNNSYKNIRSLPPGYTIWASGDSGTDFMSYDNILMAHLGPEYISCNNQMILSHDTLYVADGTAGLKIFQFQTSPSLSLTPLGQFRTRNNITHVAINGSDFYTADYYSLQHLCWGEPIGIDDNPDILPQAIGLSQNYPNPFNATTTIKYSLNRQSQVKINIYDILGRQVANLVDCQRPAGNHSATWDAAAFSSGIYLYTLQAGDNRIAKKMILLK
jgi:hypothetical protein